MNLTVKIDTPSKFRYCKKCSWNPNYPGNGIVPDPNRKWWQIFRKTTCNECGGCGYCKIEQKEN